MLPPTADCIHHDRTSRRNPASRDAPIPPAFPERRGCDARGRLAGGSGAVSGVCDAAAGACAEHAAAAVFVRG
ncbi:MAG: hypothetical protein K2Q20_12725, partial [Phycisphaerales bacterium]|nr:hypothetical protein [Phycisphaerales bacterium]